MKTILEFLTKEQRLAVIFFFFKLYAKQGILYFSSEVVLQLSLLKLFLDGGRVSCGQSACQDASQNLDVSGRGETAGGG